MKNLVTYEATIAGERLMMHNEQMANPFNEYTQALSKVTHKRQKSLEDHQEIARIEYQGGLYFDDKAGPYIPARCLNKMLVMGARRRKLGKSFEQFVMIDREINPVVYDGPRTRVGLWGREDLRDQRLVGIAQKRTLRTRPLFTDWLCTFIIRVVDAEVDQSAVLAALEASEHIGILDGRPIYAGQFTTKSLNPTDGKGKKG